MEPRAAERTGLPGLQNDGALSLYDRDEHLLTIIAPNATGSDGFLFDGYEPHGE